MKLTHIVGTRPQFVKMAAVSRAIARHNRQIARDNHVKELIVHTGQHYDENMSGVFFEELEIPKPDYNLGVGSALHGAQTGRMLEAIETVLVDERPDWVIVYGDTNSTLAGALAAAKLHIPVAHVESGLRSFNREMPEEINRVLTDHVSDLLFCPTEAAVSNLRSEGLTNIVNNGQLVPDSVDGLLFSTDRSPVVINIGDVMYDSLLYNCKLAEKRSKIFDRLCLKCKEPDKPNDYALATVHRPSNTDDLKHLQSIFEALDEIAQDGLQVIIPLHPRTRKQLQALPGLTTVANSSSPMNYTNSINPTDLIIIEPVSYLDMLLLEKNAKLILTDSGGVQKEAFILQVPCITLREETEWTETVETGWNVLTGADKEKILKAANMFWSLRPVESQGEPYGDGQAAERIVKIATVGAHL